MMIRHDVLAAIGGLDENYFLYFEETDFCRRARRAGFSTWYVPESRVMHIGGQSTQITSSAAAPGRLPSYWFESRRRYFAVTFGIRRAMAIDMVAILAHSLGWLKRVALLRTRTAKAPERFSKWHPQPPIRDFRCQCSILPQKLDCRRKIICSLFIEIRNAIF